MAKIDRVAMELCKLGVALEQEDDAAGFLGIKMERDSNTGLLKMKQTGLIERVIKVLGLDNGYARGKHMPAETKPLVKDEDGVAAAKGFSYSSVVGMLLYLLGHNRPDITYAVNCRSENLTSSLMNKKSVPQSCEPIRLKDHFASSTTTPKRDKSD